MNVGLKLFCIFVVFWLNLPTVKTCMRRFIGKECVIDEDCAKEGYYCYFNKCTSCVPCSLFNRKRPPKAFDSTCVTDKNEVGVTSAAECGECLYRYQPEEVEGVSGAFRCEEEAPEIPSFMQSYGGIMFLSILLGVIFIFLVGVFAVMTRESKLKRKSNNLTVGFNAGLDASRPRSDESINPTTSDSHSEGTIHVEEPGERRPPPTDSPITPHVLETVNVQIEHVEDENSEYESLPSDSVIAHVSETINVHIEYIEDDISIIPSE